MVGIMLAQQSNGEELAAIGVLAGLLGVVLLFVFLVNLVLTFFLWSAYKAVPAEHQKVPSGLVWLCVLPCLGSIALIVFSRGRGRSAAMWPNVPSARPMSRASERT